MAGAPPQTSCIKRLMKDLMEVRANPLPTVSAAPLSEEDLTEWHCNLTPEHGPYRGQALHLILRFPPSYPLSPPSLEICTVIPHPNVFHHRFVCLDMLREDYAIHGLIIDEEEEAWHRQSYVGGWSSAYSVLSILLQLQTFFFAEQVEQDYGGVRSTAVSEVRLSAAVRAMRSFGCEGCGHRGYHPSAYHPPPSSPSTPQPQGARGEAQQQAEAQGASSSSSSSSSSSGGGSAAAVGGGGGENQCCHLGRLNDHLLCEVLAFLRPEDLIALRQAGGHEYRERLDEELCVLRRRELLCFHDKTLWTEDVLGVGVELRFFIPEGPAAGGSRGGQRPLRGGMAMMRAASTAGPRPLSSLKEAWSSMHLLSLSAYQAGLRQGVWKERFSHFLPLALDQAHFTRALPHLLHTTAQAFNLPASQHQGGSLAAVRSAVCLLSILMNHTVVCLNSSVQQQGRRQLHASERALEGYCAYHHLLLALAQAYPVVRSHARAELRRFLQSPRERHKQLTPNLGVMLINLLLVACGEEEEEEGEKQAGPQLSWAALAIPFLQECFDRHVLWSVKKDRLLGDPHAYRLETRLQKTFEANLTSLRLLSFQVFFLVRVGQRCGLADYNKRLGQPPKGAVTDLQELCRRVMSPSFYWPQFFSSIRCSLPPQQQLFNILRDAITNSEKKGYHQPPKGRGGAGR